MSLCAFLQRLRGDCSTNSADDFEGDGDAEEKPRKKSFQSVPSVRLGERTAARRCRW